MRIPIRMGPLAAAVVAGLALVLLATPGTASATTVDAQSCYRIGCDGLDPTRSYERGTTSFCVDGAYTPFGSTWYILGGTLELVWGPNCETNWARFTPTDGDLYGMVVLGFDANGNETDIVGTGIENTFYFYGSDYSEYTDQVWSPGPAEACVEDLTFNTGFVCFSQ